MDKFLYRLFHRIPRNFVDLTDYEEISPEEEIKVEVDKTGSTNIDIEVYGEYPVLVIDARTNELKGE